MITEIRDLDDFLTALRRQLKPLAPPEREEILRELEVRLRDSVDRQGSSIYDIMQRFGSPKNIANQYLDALLLRKAAVSWSPYLLLKVMIRLAFRGVFGGFTCFCLILGYGLGAVFAVFGLLKAILPSHVGVWAENGHITLTGLQIYPPPPPAYELVGWWFIPIALILGVMFLALTTISARAVLRTLMRSRSPVTA